MYSMSIAHTEAHRALRLGRARAWRWTGGRSGTPRPRRRRRPVKMDTARASGEGIRGVGAAAKGLQGAAARASSWRSRAVGRGLRRGRNDRVKRR